MRKVETNRQHRTRMHENMEEDIDDRLAENTTALSNLREESLEIKTLITNAFKNNDDDELNFTLPITNIDDYIHIEDSFNTLSAPETIELLNIFTKELQDNIENKCDTLAESIQKLLQQLFHESFIIHCYWKNPQHPADKYKIEFSEVIACVYISLEKMWPDFTEKQFEYVITNWLENTKIKFLSLLGM